MENHNILSKLESMMPFFSNAEKKLGSFILENPKDVLNMATSEIAKKSGVSEASVIRFTRKLGLNGYTDLKLTISANLQSSSQPSLLSDMSPKDSPFEIYKKLSAFTITSIQTSEDVLNEEALQKATDLIYQAKLKHKRVYLSGVGASSILASQIQMKLMRLNIPTIFFEDSHLQLESTTYMRKDDLLICFTTLGKSLQINQHIDIANKVKAQVLLITQYGNQKLAEKADVTLFISAVENNLRLTSQTALTVQTMVIDTLFLAIALKDFNHIKKDVEKTKEIFYQLGYYTHM